MVNERLYTSEAATEGHTDKLCDLIAVKQFRIYKQAVGKAMLLSILRQLLLMIPLIHLFSGIWGLHGILYAGPTADFLTSFLVAGLIAYDSKSKKKRV